MRDLFNLLLRNGSWIFAIAIIIFCFYLIFSNNPYQRSVFLTSSNKITSSIYKTNHDIKSYFSLKKENKLLHEELANIESENFKLKEYINLNLNISADSIPINSDSIKKFNFITAEIINFSLSGAGNYITINKGSKDGLKPDMGVISTKGIVGVIFKVSNNFSSVIPLVNSKFKIVAKVKNAVTTGSVSWAPKELNYAIFTKSYEYDSINNGDTVVTNFSTIFPKDLTIGYIENSSDTNKKNNTYKIKLANDFRSVNKVFVIENKIYNEQKELESNNN